MKNEKRNSKKFKRENSKKKKEKGKWKKKWKITEQKIWNNKDNNPVERFRSVKKRFKRDFQLFWNIKTIKTFKNNFTSAQQILILHKLTQLCINLVLVIFSLQKFLSQPNPTP